MDRSLQIGRMDTSLGSGNKLEASLGLIHDARPLLDRVRDDPWQIKDIPKYQQDEEIALEAVSADGALLKYVSRKAMSERVLLAALANGGWLYDIPEEKRTLAVCIEGVKHGAPLDAVPKELREQLPLFVKTEDGPCLSAPAVDLGPELFPESWDYEWVPAEASLEEANGEEGETELVPQTNPGDFSVWYVSDIHLEHQIDAQTIDEDGYDIPGTRDVYRIAKELKTSSEFYRRSGDWFLFAGDIAHTPRLVDEFFDWFECCENHLPSHAIAVLGNHELWDGIPNPSQGFKARAIDEIVESYRALLAAHEVTLLENDLLVVYKGARCVVLREEKILAADDNDLTDLLAKSTFTVLGGCGFTGMNPHFNAQHSGIYRATIRSFEADLERSARFCAVYAKVLRCGCSQRVIVLTHTPKEDWSDSVYNPNWIYIHGHTHHNNTRVTLEGARIYADGQLGYSRKTASYSRFELNWHTYDPLASFPDGDYVISPEVYREFWSGRKQLLKPLPWPGEIHALKSDGTYMFVLETDKTLCLLDGNARKSLDWPRAYYLEHLSRYARLFREAMGPFQVFLETLGRQVKLIGGMGTVHGCIVDINYWCHIFVNPLTGYMTPYWALNKGYRAEYRTVRALVKDVCPELVDKVDLIKADKSAPLLFRNTTPREREFTVESSRIVEGDASMYDPSTQMKKVQYLLEDDVVRFWRDDLLALSVEDVPEDKCFDVEDAGKLQDVVRPHAQ